MEQELHCPACKYITETETVFTVHHLDVVTETTVQIAGNYKYAVTSHELEKDYIVNLQSRTCDCKRWQLSGIPCHHVIACCSLDRINPDNLVHACYTIDAFNSAYAYNLAPLRGRLFWQNMNAVPIHPPLYTKVMGRPKKNRRKAPEEKMKKGVHIFTKAGVSIHCSVCGVAGHNKKGHAKYIETRRQQEEMNIVGEGDEVDMPEMLQVCLHTNAHCFTLVFGHKYHIYLTQKALFICSMSFHIAQTPN